jgi:hypothetical protein
MLAFETAIAVSQLTRMRRGEGELRAEDCCACSHRAARSGLLALVSAFGVFSLFVLVLDISARQSWVPADDQQASYQSTSQYGASE